ncbi:MAG TPA: DUF6527 family protein [Hanamia sp.]
MRIIQLNKVKYLPNELEPGVLYVSEEYSVAGHLCACGCGSKVITPLGPTEWTFSESKGKATLDPSIGNWQLPCRSHYWIINSKIEWSYQWTDKQIKTGWKAEENKRKKYYKSRSKKQSFITKIITWLYH